jgi:hypothetical protein
MLGGQSNQSLPPPDELDEAQPAVPSRSSPSDSFTKAFVGVNAFSRDPAGLTSYSLDSEVKQEATADGVPPRSPGSFTRLFGSGEGVLTPSGTDEHSRPPLVRDAEQSSPPRPETSPSSFTEVFEPLSAAIPAGPKKDPRSFTEEFDSPRSWQTPNSSTPSTSPSRFPGTSDKGGQILPATPKPPSTPTQAFERLVGAPRPDPTPSTGATIVFDRSGSPESEFTGSQAESEYTMVRKLSDLRSGKEASGAAVSRGSPSGAPVVPQREQFGPAAPPAWTPPASNPPWQPPAPPPVPQPPTFSPPAIPQKPLSLGDRLISLLPFMLALTVINFLGLLAVLIILFATRR